MGRTLKAIVEIDLDRHGTEPQISFLARVKQEENITHAYSIIGASDILLILTLKMASNIVLESVNLAEILRPYTPWMPPSPVRHLVRFHAYILIPPRLSLLSTLKSKPAVQ